MGPLSLKFWGKLFNSVYLSPQPLSSIIASSPGPRQVLLLCGLFPLGGLQESMGKV